MSPAPGSTPDPVGVSGGWNPATQKGVLTWIASPNPNVASYSVRTAPAPYKADEETAIGSVAPNVTTFSTDVGLAAPGSVAQFRVYVVLKSENERGSATVKITRV